MNDPAGRRVESRSPDTVDVDLGADRIIVGLHDRRLHTLNDTAAAVWDRIDGTRSVDEICSVLAIDYDTSPETIRVDVETVLGAFDDAGLTGTEVTPSVPHCAARTSRWVDRRIELLDQRARHRVGTYEALGWCFSLAVDEDALADELGGMLAALQAPEQRGRGRVHIVARRNGTEVSIDGRRTASGLDGVSAADHLLWQMNRRAISSVHDAVVLHAGGVQRGDRVVVFPASTNQGKSTLTTHLVDAGFDYLSDEAVAIGLGTLLARPYPKPISLDRGSFTLVPELEPTGREGVARSQWHVPATRIRPGSVGRGGSVAAVVLPHRRAVDQPALTRLEVNEAFRTLLENTFAFEASGRSAVETLAELARTTPTYELAHGGIEHHGDQIVAIVERLAKP